ncbi:MAG: YdbH domain-containing protein [Lentisphaeria bacterium]|nr:YdbH domain-containing protein [Lentisphaeria bacterium]
MPKHVHPDIPIRFQRAARRAAFFKWTLRLALPPLVLAGVISLTIIWRHSQRRAGSSPDGGTDIPPPPSGPLTITLQDQAIEIGPLTMAMEEIAVSQSPAGVARGDIDRVHIPRLIAALDWRAPVGESFKNQVSAITGGKPVNIKRLEVKAGELTIRPPGAAAIQVPFTLTATHQEKGPHHFEGELSPGSHPVRFSGELDPLTGNGNLTAAATAIELAQWLEYLLPRENSRWTVTELAAKTDLQLSLLFQNYSLVWGHLDMEIAGIDARLVFPVGAQKPPRARKSLQAMIHSAHLTADLIADDQRPGWSDLRYALDVKQGQWRGEKEPSKGQCETLTARGTVRFSPAGPPVHTLDGAIAAPDWHGETARVTAPATRFSIPSFSNPDALRWRATVTSPAAVFQGIALDAPAADIIGTLIDLAFTTPVLTAKRGAFTARCEPFQGRISADTSLGEGVLTSVTQNQHAHVDAATPFSVQKNNAGNLTLTMPKLLTPVFPGASLTGVTVTMSEDTVTLRGDASLGPSLLNQLAWLPAPLEGTPLSASFKCVQTATTLFAMTIPEQAWTLKGDDWQLSASIGGTVEVDNQPGGILKSAMKATRVVFKSESCDIAAAALELRGFKWRASSQRHASAADFLTRPGSGNITGSITVENAVISLPPYHAHKVDIQLPFSWNGQQGFVSPGLPGQEPPVLRMEKLSVGKVDFFPRELSMLPDKRAITFKTTFSDTAESVSGFLESAVTLNREPAALFRLRLSCPELADVPWLNRLPLPVPGPATYAGALEGDISLFIDRVGTAGTGSLQLRDVTVTDKQTFTLSGINTGMRFQEVFPLTTPPGQIVTLRDARLGRFSLGAGELRFQLPGTAGVYVESATAAWCGGLLATRGVTLSPDTNSLTVDITAENLLLDQVLQAFPYLDAVGAGRLNARLPLRLEDGQIKSTNLTLSSAGKGRLRCRRPEAFLRSLGDKPPHDKTLLEAFADVTYDSWNLRLSDVPSPSLSFAITGAVPTRRDPKPFQYARQRALPTADLLKAIPAIFADSAEKKPESDSR